jgi:hypothetical protein
VKAGVFSTAAMDQLEFLIAQMTEQLEQSRKDEKRLREEISRVQSVLELSDTETASVAGDAEEPDGRGRLVQYLESELARLTEMRRERLPALLDSYECDIRDLAQRMHYSEEQVRAIFDALPEDPCDRLEAMRATRSHLRVMRDESEEIVKTMAQRGKIVADYANLGKSDKMAAEKTERRYKKVLPRVEKHLKLQLLQFEEDHGTAFMWDGQPILKELEHVVVTPEERKMSRRRSKEARLTMGSAREEKPVPAALLIAKNQVT